MRGARLLFSGCLQAASRSQALGLVRLPDAPPGLHPTSHPRLPCPPSPPPRSFQWRDQCHKCGVAKPEEGAEANVEVAIDPGLQPGQMARPGDWRCTACNNIK